MIDEPGVHIWTESVNDLGLLQRGDHIAVEGQVGVVKYYHHGIYLGHDKVADLGGTNKKDSNAQEIGILEFIDKGRRQLIRYIYRADKCCAAGAAARNAEWIVANPGLWGAYDLITNNCEHFATRCKVGEPVSWQVIGSCRQKGAVILAATLAKSSPAREPLAALFASADMFLGGKKNNEISPCDAE